KRLDFVKGSVVRFILGCCSIAVFVDSVLRRCRGGLPASLFISHRRLDTLSGSLIVVTTITCVIRYRRDYIGSVLGFRWFHRSAALTLIPVSGGGVNPRVLLTNIFALITRIAR